MKSITKKLFAATIILALIVSMFLVGCASVPVPVQSAPSGTMDVTAADAASPSATVQAAIAAGAQLSYVSIDINPSIELTLADGLVLEARAYNDDGAAIILATDVMGKKLLRTLYPLS